MFEVVGIGSYTAIADAGNSLLKILRDNMTPEPISTPEMIGLCSPTDKGDIKLGLYLYSIRENGEFRDMGFQNSPTLTVNLFYLMTAYSTVELKLRAYDESCILGKAMQIIYDNSILRGSNLQGTLSEKDEELRIVLHYLNTDEMSKIWTFSDVPYKISVGYMVGPVNIDSNRLTVFKRVTK
jgi:hypothetical protein